MERLSKSFSVIFFQDAGFKAQVISADSRNSGVNHHKSLRKWRMTFIFSLVFAIPTVIIAFVPVEFLPITAGLTTKEVLLFLLSSFVQVSAASVLKKI